MTANIVDTDDRIFIDGIPTMKYGEQMDNSFIRSIQLSLNALGENYSYEYLMGISGAGFRLHFDPKWCPSSTDATCGFDVSEVIFKSLGYDVDFKRINHNSFEDIKSLYGMIRNHINKGRPVVAINLMGNMDWGIVTGYLKNEPGILCRTYYDETVGYSIADHAPWLNFFIGEKKNGLSREELYKQSLKIAIELAETKKFDEYYSGFHAYEKWISRLKGIDDSFSREDLTQILEIHFIILNALLDARRSSLAYLSNLISETNSKLPALTIAYYSEIVQMLESSIMEPGKNNKADPLQHTREFFGGQADVLKHVLQIEKKAVEHIKKVL